jgi:Domain of unknown function (DUF5655)
VPQRSSEKDGWRCPDCGRWFKQRTREHSCDVQTLESHVGRGSEEIRAAFDAVKRALSGFGPYEIVPLKTMVVLRIGSNFGGLVFGKTYLDASFFLTRQLRHARVLRIEQMSASKVAYRVRVSARGDVDAELIAWLQQAYVECARSSGA